MEEKRPVTLATHWWVFIREAIIAECSQATPDTRRYGISIVAEIDGAGIQKKPNDSRTPLSFELGAWQYVVRRLVSLRDQAPKGLAGLGQRSQAQLILSVLELQRATRIERKVGAAAVEE